VSKQNENKALTTALKVLTWYTADHQQVAGILDGLDCVFEEVETLHDEDAEKIALYWGLQDMKAVTVSRISFSKYPDFLIRLVVDERVASVTELPEVGARALRLFSNGSSTEISPLSTQTRNSSELVESANNDSSFDLLHIASDEYIEEVNFYTKVLGKSARFVEDDIIINNPLSSMSSILLERLEEPLESDGVTSRFPTAGWVMTSSYAQCA